MTYPNTTDLTQPERSKPRAFSMEPDRPMLDQRWNELLSAIRSEVEREPVGDFHLDQADWSIPFFANTREHGPVDEQKAKASRHLVFTRGDEQAQVLTVTAREIKLNATPEQTRSLAQYKVDALRRTAMNHMRNVA